MSSRQLVGHENRAENTIQIINNKFGYYEGDLRHYFRVLFNEASNVFNHYHNMRHMLHVLWEVYDGACYHYLAPRQTRNLLISAMFHDFNHSGRVGNDDAEIERAIRGFREHVLPEDMPWQEYIESGIKITRYPYVTPAEELSLSSKILRDADISQSLSPVWVQQTLFGLSVEAGITPFKLLCQQEKFLSGIQFASPWGYLKFDPLRHKRIDEAKEVLAVLEEDETLLVPA